MYCKLVSKGALSLLLALIASLAWSNLAGTIRSVEEAQNIAALKKAIDSAQLSAYGIEDLSKTLSTQLTMKDKSVLLQFLHNLESGGDAIGAINAQSEAKKIASSPIYRDHGPGEQRNFVGDSFDNLGEAIKNFLERLFESPNTMPNFTGPTIFGNFVMIFAYVILGLAVVGIIWLLVRSMMAAQLAKKKVAKVGGLLEEDEPDRTADEWLTRAAELEASGDFRGAVRCLYLACLVRFDDLGIAQFIRSETNWEHLYRISASPSKPSNLDFRTPTKKFDNIWYGHMVKGKEDVQEFRAIYTSILALLQSRSGGSA